MPRFKFLLIQQIEIACCQFSILPPILIIGKVAVGMRVLIRAAAYKETGTTMTRDSTETANFLRVRLTRAAASELS